MPSSYIPTCCGNVSERRGPVREKNFFPSFVVDIFPPHFARRTNVPPLNRKKKKVGESNFTNLQGFPPSFFLMQHSSLNEFYSFFDDPLHGKDKRRSSGSSSIFLMEEELTFSFQWKLFSICFSLGTERSRTGEILFCKWISSVDAALRTLRLQGSPTLSCDPRSRKDARHSGLLRVT